MEEKKGRGSGMRGSTGEGWAQQKRGTSWEETEGVGGRALSRSRGCLYPPLTFHTPFVTIAMRKFYLLLWRFGDKVLHHTNRNCP